MAPSNPFALLDESEDATPVVKAPEPKVEAAKAGGAGAWGRAWGATAVPGGFF